MKANEARATEAAASEKWWEAQEQIDALQAYINMVSLPVQAREVVYSDNLLASDAVKQYGNYMGGLFIAEDTGGAIKVNRIDVGVASHTRAYELGIEYADVWVLEGERWLAHNYTTVPA